MRSRWLVALVVPLIAAGCAGDAGPDSTQNAPTDRTINIAQVIAPDVNTPQNLALLHGREKLKVGDEWEYAKKLFAEPRGSYEVNDLPPGLTGPDYRARGWESANEGFGVILYKDKIAVAMYRVERAEEARVDEFLDNYRDYFGRPVDAVPPELLDTESKKKFRSRYWFWEQGNQRLMICAVTTLADGTNVSVAVGDKNTMNALGMSALAAKSDQAKAERALAQQFELQSGH